MVAVHKYRNVPTTVDGVLFASKKEARRWGELQLLQRAGVIRELRRQVAFPLAVNGVPICKYISDFTYNEGKSNHLTVEDSKGVLTKDCALKLKLMKAIHGIDVRLT